MNRLPRWTLWVLAATAAAGLVAAARLALPQAPGPATPQAGRPKTQALPVTGMTLQPVRFAETIVASGTLRAEESVELQSEVSGKVVTLVFQEGSRVRAGDLLVKIDDATLQASLRRSLARQQVARYRAERIGRVAAEGGSSRQVLDEALSELAVQEAEADLIRAEIRRTEIRAPFDGIVGLRFVSTGAYVTPATRIATLQSLDRLKVDFSVPERYAGRVTTGSTLSFQVAGSGSTFTGSVYAVEPRIDISTRTILLRAVCANPGLELVPGLFARIELPVNRADDALLVPAIAVISGLEERFVFVARDGRASRVRVRTGARTPTHVQVLEGLAPGDVVLTSGTQQLREGLPVSVEPAT